MVTATLDEKGWLYRAFEVTTPEGNYRVTYNGRGLGHESVTVDGKFAAGQNVSSVIYPGVSVCNWVEVGAAETEGVALVCNTFTGTNYQ